MKGRPRDTGQRWARNDTARTTTGEWRSSSRRQSGPVISLPATRIQRLMFGEPCVNVASICFCRTPADSVAPQPTVIMYIQYFKSIFFFFFKQKTAYEIGQ